MKKIITLLIIFQFFSNIIKSQTKWTETPFVTNSCFKGISVSLKARDYNSIESKDGSGIWIKVQIKNTYNKKAHVSLTVWVDGDNSKYFESQGSRNGLFTINANSTSVDTDIPVSFKKPQSNFKWRYEIQQVCFADTWGGCSETLEGWPRHAECDNGTPNYKFVTKNNSPKNQDNSGNSSSNNGSNMSGKSTQQLVDELNKLCEEVNRVESANAKNTVTVNCDGRNFSDDEMGRKAIESRIKALQVQLDAANKGKKAEEERKRAEEERLNEQRKVWAKKTETFTNLINEGDIKLQNKQYDEAIAKYLDAKRLYVSDVAPQEEAYANQAITIVNAKIAAAEKAKADAARKIRVEEKQKVEQKQNDATVSAATSIAGVMALLKDEYSPGLFAAKMQVGLGYGSTGIISNSDFNKKSLTKSSNQLQFRLGFKLAFANNKGISFQLNPLLDIGLNSFQKGIDGSSAAYGGMGTLFIGKEAKSKIKLFAEVGYLSTAGSYNYDQAVAEGSTSTSDNVEKAEFSFSTIRYGGGIMLHFIDKNKETFIKPGIFLEKPSFAQSGAKPVMVGNLQVNIKSIIIIDISYSKNYLIGGQLAYPFNFTKDDINFWSIKLIRQGKIK